MFDMRIKKWGRLQYSNPKKTLLAFRSVEENYDLSAAEYEIRSLRNRKLRHWHEERQLALFCYGMSCVSGAKVVYHFGDDIDYDGVALWADGFVPIQLKEWCPEHIGKKPKGLNEELQKLKKYSGGDLVVAYYLNRVVKDFNWKELILPDLDIAELWFFGGLTPDNNEWFIIGDMLNTPQLSKFNYPS